MIVSRTLASVAALLLSTSVFAADAIVEADPAPLPAPVYDADYFVVTSLLYGWGAIDQDVNVNGTNGEVQTDFELGGKVELGKFVTENVRVSADLRFSHTEFDDFDFSGGSVGIRDTDTKSYSAFVNIAYETPLSDLGLNIPFFERTKVFAIAGVGVGHLDLDANADTLNDLPLNDDDTAILGKVGLGSVFDISDRIALVSETNYIFGSDYDFSDADDRVSLEPEGFVSSIGLRFKF